MQAINYQFLMRRSMSILWQTSFRPYSKKWNPVYTGGFPKHKELFADDYYDTKETEDKRSSGGNPYGTDAIDYEDW